MMPTEAVNICMETHELIYSLVIKTHVSHNHNLLTRNYG